MEESPGEKQRSYKNSLGEDEVVERFKGREGMVIRLSLEDAETASAVCHALSTPLRLKILQQLGVRNYYVNELAELLNIPPSTAALNVRILENAGLIMTSAVPGNRGVAKMCHRMVSDVQMHIDPMPMGDSRQINYSLPIGSYNDCEPGGEFCGLVTEKSGIGENNDPASFYDPERIHAQLIWLYHGYLEYRVSNRELRRSKLQILRISFEACSETANYNPDWPSDIYVSVNGVELGVWTCPGDFGGRRGMVSPDWWPVSSTHFGQLKLWEVTAEGTFLDGALISHVGLQDLGLDRGDYFTLRIGVHPDAVHLGGMNLFGAKFGDYPQDILLQFSLKRDD